MKDLIENLLDTILHDRLISRAVDRLLSGNPRGCGSTAGKSASICMPPW
jgi:hypothetical protein